MFEIDPNKKKVQLEIGKKGVEAAFVKEMAKQGGKAYKFTSEMNRGVSDRITIFYESVWFVEVKKLDGELTSLQESFRDRCIRLKLNHFVVYGVPGIRKFIKHLKNKGVI